MMNEQCNTTQIAAKAKKIPAEWPQICSQELANRTQPTDPKLQLDATEPTWNS
jgi:hypothetical protein